MPNAKALFGSATTFVPTEGVESGMGCPHYSYKKFSQVIYITKTHIKALDQPTQRCSQENVNVNTSLCLARFIENQLKCNTMILGSQYSKTTPCTTRSELFALANISRLLEHANENDIYKMTGCLSACEKDQYSLSAGPLEMKYGRGYEKCQVHLEFIILDSSYKEEEQYVIYEADSFIADVGGYMGLLLGSSLLSLYMAMETFMKKLLCRLFKG